MENNFEQYETLLGCVSETAEACLDMEGGAFFLAWAGELIQDLAGKGYLRSARLTAQKLCEAAGTDCAWAERDELEPPEIQVWLNLFAEALMYHVMTVLSSSGTLGYRDYGGAFETAKCARKQGRPVINLAKK